MIIILDVGNRPIRVMDGDFKTEGDPVIPGRPLCRQPNFPARLIPPVSKDAVEGKRKERKRKKREKKRNRIRRGGETIEEPHDATLRVEVTRVCTRVE